LEALDAVEPVSVADASADDRWPHFGNTAAGLGVHSTLSIHLPVDAAEVAASLNLYSRRYMQLSDAQMRAALPFAEQLAAAILSVDAYRSAAGLARDMAEAMRSRAVIEQAKGILMADQQISADEAFQQLTKLSQHTNTKLREVASRLVTERTEGGRSA
jgi:hypothetical protein